MTPSRRLLRLYSLLGTGIVRMLPGYRQIMISGNSIQVMMFILMQEIYLVSRFHLMKKRAALMAATTHTLCHHLVPPSRCILTQAQKKATLIILDLNVGIGLHIWQRTSFYYNNTDSLQSRRLLARSRHTIICITRLNSRMTIKSSRMERNPCNIFLLKTSSQKIG